MSKTSYGLVESNWLEELTATMLEEVFLPVTVVFCISQVADTEVVPVYRNTICIFLPTNWFRLTSQCASTLRYLSGDVQKFSTWVNESNADEYPPRSISGKARVPSESYLTYLPLLFFIELVAVLPYSVLGCQT